MSGENEETSHIAPRSSSDVLSEGIKARDNGELKKSALAFKTTHILVSLFFLWILIIHAIGLFVFTRGFLLTRLVLDDQSDCAILPDGTPSFARDGCWHPKSFDRAVIIVIDALRYDFAVPFQASESQYIPKHYHNNFQSLYSTAVEQPANALLLPFIADPPTSTLQRLKALTAGNLPTFIDIGSSFAGSATEEDNILVQLKKNGKTIVHLGDDTWHSLFPGYFHQNLTHAYDSFNVWDLHTVDNGVIDHIFPLLRDPDKSGWDVMIAHFLGVDHAGHRYGPDHEAMADKLRQMDRTMNDIMNSIDDTTLMIVMGDHGMDQKGDHGGESDEEVESTLWMYSRRPKFGRLHNAHSKPPSTAKERPVAQIDLVSTLSLLLGLPVPYGNLGTPIPEAFIGSQGSDWDKLATVDMLVFDQIRRYQSQYTKFRELEVDRALETETKGIVTERSIGSTSNPQDIIRAYKSWHESTIAMYRRLWANFDTVSMLLGAILSTFGLCALSAFYLLTDSHTTIVLPRILRGIGLGAIMGAVFGSAFAYAGSYADISSSTLLGACAFSLAAAVYTLLHNPEVSTRPALSFWDWLAIIFTFSQAAGFASNSYTIHEDTILLFLLTSFGAVAFASSLRQGVKADQVLGVYHSVLFVLLARVASYSRLCREEQMPGCRSTFYASQTSSTSAPWQLLVPYVIAIVLPEIIKAFYRGTASYTGSAGFWIGFCVRIGLLFVAAYWTIDAADNGKWVAARLSSSTMKTIGIVLARCVFGMAIPVGIGTFLWSKPCLDISVVSGAPPSAPGATPSRPTVTVLGYANAFGARYFLVIPVLILMTIILLPPMGQFSMAILTWQILCLLEILDTNQLTINASTSSAIGPVVLAMLGSYHFFKTGHQAALSSIQWNAAFIPFRTLVYPFAPILILFNTFGAQIICAAAVPLTVLWKRPVSGRGLQGIWSNITKACLAHVFYYSTIQLATTLWAGHLRRHLMLYRVFMPRFLMASVVLLVIDVVIIVVSLGSTKVTAESVAELFGY